MSPSRFRLPDYLATVVGIGCLVLSAKIAPAGVVYVDAAAPPGGSGSSWSGALSNLASALAAAQTGDELWVKAGTYSGPITLRPTIALYGGFAGVETNRSQRDWGAHPTTITGNNTTRCILSSAGDASTIVDGFTITNGFADRRASTGNDPVGGAILVSAGQFLLANSTVTDNRVFGYSAGLPYYGYGGGIAVRGGAIARFEGVLLTNNRFGTASTPTAGYGGALYVNGATATLINCTFDGNFGGNGSMDSCASGMPLFGLAPGSGGAIAGDANSILSVDRCTFRRNHTGNGPPGITCTTGTSHGYSGGAGGAVWFVGTQLTISNSSFIGNLTGTGGASSGSGGSGGAIYSNAPNVAITNCTFTGNAIGSGGSAAPIAAGAAVAASGATMVNGIAFGNLGGSGSNWTRQLSIGIVSYSCVDDYIGTAPGMISGDPHFIDADGPDNILGTADDNLGLRFDSPCLDAGNNAVIVGSIDLARHPRRVTVPGFPRPPGSPFRIDIGALELQVCPVDYDDGSTTGRPDGGITIDDLLFYLAVFGSGDIRADVDNGSSTGTLDNGVGIEDLLYFLIRYNSGC